MTPMEYISSERLSLERTLKMLKERRLWLKDFGTTLDVERVDKEIEEIKAQIDYIDV